MPSPTTNFGFAYPTDGGSNAVWGGILNTFVNALDTSLQTVLNVANAALAKAGGVMSGRLDLLTASTARIDKGAISGAQTLDISLAQYFTLTVNGALTPSFINAPAGTLAQGVILRITNGGSAVITWAGSVKWVSGVAPTLTVAGVDLLGFITDDNGTTWRGLVLGKDLR